MITVTLFYSQDCQLCSQAEEDLKSLQSSIPHQLVLVDIESDVVLKEELAPLVPVVQVGPYRLRAPFSRQDLQVALSAARDRKESLEKAGSKGYQRRVERGQAVSGTDRVSYWLSKRYMLLINFVVLLYVGLPFLAPAMMKIGIQAPARVIYMIYSPLCHQLAFRSWFLFGEQPYYPRALAEIPNLDSYEQFAGRDSIDLLEARRFLGNEEMGYKVALCQRDIAIYGGILLFGLLFMISGRRFKPIPWYLWLFIGMAPMGLDGVSQLPSLMREIFPNWVLARESTPLLRTITGGLFGLTTAWYIFPLIEEAMLDTRRILARKIAILEGRQSQSLDYSEHDAVQTG